MMNIDGETSIFYDFEKVTRVAAARRAIKIIPNFIIIIIDPYR